MKSESSCSQPNASHVPMRSEEKFGGEISEHERKPEAMLLSGRNQETFSIDLNEKFSSYKENFSLLTVLLAFSTRQDLVARSSAGSRLLIEHREV
jgi:hypothetical protein